MPWVALKISFPAKPEENPSLFYVQLKLYPFLLLNYYYQEFKLGIFHHSQSRQLGSRDHWKRSKSQARIPVTNESVCKLLIALLSPWRAATFLCTLWSSDYVKLRIHFLLHCNICSTLKHISPALIFHRPFGNPSFQAVLCRCMIVFEIPAPINHCSVTCFTLYLLSSLPQFWSASAL